MYNSFRKLFLAVVVIAAVPLFHTYAHAAYTTGFETAESYNWMTIKNTDSVGEATTDWAEVVTKAYGSNTDNKALALKTGTNQYSEYGSVDTGHINTTLVNNPVTGKLVISLDFMLEGETWANHTRDETTMLTARMNGSVPTDYYIARVSKASAGYGRIYLVDTSNANIFLGRIQPDTWNRITVLYDPATGMADYTLTTNVDNSNATTVYCPDFQLTPADTYTGINRIKMSMTRPNLKFFFDNLSLYEHEGINLTASSPEDGAESADAYGGITLVFDDKVASQAFTLNGTRVTFDADESGMVLKYSGNLIANREYILQGIVTDENGHTIQVNHQFKTASTFRLISATVRNGDTGIIPTDTLLFEFNHRIDPCDNSFSITGGAEIESYNVKGKILEIKLSEVLDYDTYYTVNLNGLGDLYSEEYYEPQITFKTLGLSVNYAKFVDGADESLSVIDSANTRYKAEFINNTSKTIDIIFVMTLTENDRIKEIVFTPYSVEQGDRLSIDEGFTDLDTQTGDYQIKVFYLDSLETLSPYDTKMLPMVIIGEQSDM